MIIKAYENPETSHVFLVSEEPVTKGGKVVVKEYFDIDEVIEPSVKLVEYLFPVDDEHILTRNEEVVSIDNYMRSKYGCATRK